MKKLSNKNVALLTIGSWLLIAVIAFVNGFMYGYPAEGSILPRFIIMIIGWFSFFMNMYALVRLYKTSERSDSFGIN